MARITQATKKEVTAFFLFILFSLWVLQLAPIVTHCPTYKLDRSMAGTSLQDDYLTSRIFTLFFVMFTVATNVPFDQKSQSWSLSLPEKLFPSTCGRSCSRQYSSSTVLACIPSSIAIVFDITLL